MTVHGLIWNCRGLKKNGVSTFLKSLIFQYNFDFIGLQETMVEECEVSLLIRKFDTHQDYLWEWIPSKGRSGGILVGICLNKYDVGSFTKGDFMIQMNLWDKENKLKWNLIVVYGPAHDDLKFDFLCELSRFCDASAEPFLIGADFNIIRYANEKSSNRGVHRHSGVFNSIIHFFELRELIMSRGIYTWMICSCLNNSPIYQMSVYMCPKTISEKIDKIWRVFFWQGGGTKKKYHLMRWVKICKSKKERWPWH